MNMIMIMNISFATLGGVVTKKRRNTQKASRRPV